MTFFFVYWVDRLLSPLLLVHCHFYLNAGYLSIYIVGRARMGLVWVEDVIMRHLETSSVTGLYLCASCVSYEIFPCSVIPRGIDCVLLKPADG